VDLGLAGKTALVTGSYRGTGAGMARALAAEGATVLVHGFETGQADAVVASIAGAGGIAHAVVGNQRTDDGTAALVVDLRRVVERVDIVIDNFGVPDGRDWESSDTASWHGSYDANVVSAVRVTQAFLPDMRAAGWGRVLFVATIGVTRPGDRIPEYYAAKAALPAMAVGLAKHLAGTGITVNCLSPGIVATDEVVASYRERARRAGSSTEWAAVERLILDGPMGNPTGRVATPDDVGRVVAMLVGEPAWHLNGAHVRLDGGAVDTVT
jgi:NAD(P)-dependent dehydrogenase (short-subunit alcohol dehydrogenase family)